MGLGCLKPCNFDRHILDESHSKDLSESFEENYRQMTSYFVDVSNHAVRMEGWKTKLCGLVFSWVCIFYL